MTKEEMRQRTCCFTGHRVIRPQDRARLEKQMEATLRQLIAEGYLFFAAGGALGYDMLAEETVLRLREEFPQIRLILVLPCNNQTRGWRDAEVRRYNEILRRADKISCPDTPYYNGCMRRRNQELVNGSSVCVCYLLHGRSGTAQTVALARERGLRIIELSQEECVD